MKIYTRTGDAGTTALVGGSRTPKDDARVEAYGTVDELNAHIGLLTTYPKCPPEEREVLIFVQNRLFNIGAYLANPDPAAPIPVCQNDITRLENSIDRMERMTPPADRFTLPGGCTLSAQAHVARTVARRAERRIVTLASQVSVASSVLAFINRLSDWFYVFSRYNNVISDAHETFWTKDF
ncbi:MAG: cob(I)yrinic acid a,c-diamide adenosyltransferase [Muribaculaceae bacterium]|nr:cob(I)yrinic acid a,c-diamide adenosyltransferase [Muribaculaceae bacterium]MDE6314978.1 cob(I)yrinic acid a,c-diamide adenosyltransferase [Muribaculaceae bacterium]